MIKNALKRLIPPVALVLMLFLSTYINDSLIESDHADELSAHENVESAEIIEQKNSEWFEIDTSSKLTVRYFFHDSQSKIGDAILIQTPDGKSMLIDAAIEQVSSELDQYLQKLGISYLDAAINTHPHPDHVGGFPALMERITVDQMYLSNLPYESSYALNFMDTLADAEIDPIYVEEGDTFKLGEHVEIEILNPSKGTSPESHDTWDTAFMNNQSLVIRLVYEENVFLFASDIYAQSENRLVNEHEDKLSDVDVLHAPHHGDSSSSSPPFVRTIDPEIVLISSNLPNSSVVTNRYLNYTDQIFMTRDDGHILVISDGKSLETHTSK